MVTDHSQSPAPVCRVTLCARLYAALLGKGEKMFYPMEPGRHAWVQVARGAVALDGEALRECDGAAVSDERAVKLTGEVQAELLLFDLA